MVPPGSASEASGQDALRVIQQSDRPATPFSASEIAAELECPPRTARTLLEELADQGHLYSKALEEGTRVWWPAAPNGTAALTTREPFNREQFRSFIEAVQDYAIFLLDRDGHVVSWNDGAERIKGYSEPAIIGEHFSTFYTQADIDEGVPERNLAAAAEAGAVEDEGWRVRQDGSQFWANVTITAIHDGAGDLQGFTKVTRDMTERREYERQLEAQAERLERRRDELEQELDEVFERIDDAFYALDGEFRFTYVNDQAEAYFGTAASDLLGRVVWDVIDVEEDDPIFDEFETAMATQEPMGFERYFEPLGMWATVRVYPSETGLSVYFRDITERKERERELEQYETIIESVNDGVYVVDADRNFQWVNATYAELLGYTREELIGENASMVVDDEVIRDAEEVEREQGYEHLPRMDVELQTADGDTVPVEAASTVLPGGAADGWFRAGVVRDITDRRERERELEEQRERYRTLMEAAPVSIATYDRDGTLTYVNQAGVELMGASEAAALLGEPAIEFVHPDDRAAAAERMQRVIEAREAVPPKETRVVTPDGEVMHTIITSVPITQKCKPAAQVVLTDISARKERERALERYETLIRESTDVNAILDPDGTFTYVTPSAAHVLGYDAEALVGTDSYGYVHPDDRERTRAMFGALVDGAADPPQAEFRFRHADGSWVWLEAHGRNLLDDPDIDGLVVYTRDVTDRKRYEERLSETVAKLEESNERLEQFAYLASHDLQEPLRMISSYLQLIDRRYADALDEDGEEFIEYAVGGVERMRAMIDDLLAYSRVDTRAEPLEPTDCGAVIERVRRNLEMQVEETDATLTVGSMPTVLADERQLEQVFQNLVSNAIKYRGDDPPRIEISAERDGDAWVVSVTDNGMGIAAEYTDRIFEVFQRLHTEEEYPGTGIGLALCKKIVERHGGDIWVESEPGEGSTFSFTLRGPETQ